MTRINPPYTLSGYPCSVCAVSCALDGNIPVDAAEYIAKIKEDGYATLNAANRFIRDHLPVEKRTDYKRGQRPKLKDLHLDGKAIVCIYGHYIYLDKERYWSFFDNEEDDVVAVWRLKDEG